MNERINKPWGHEEVWAHTDKYVGKILFINRGEKLSRQYHEIKDETICVLDGVLILELGSGTLEDPIEINILKEGESYRIKPLTVHRFGAPLSGYVKLVEVSTPELDDVIRLEDDYGRA